MDENFETLVLEGSFPLCQQVRKELQLQFEYIWLYIYLKNKDKNIAIITVSNAMGKKLPKERSQQIITYAKHFYGKLRKNNQKIS